MGVRVRGRREGLDRQGPAPFRRSGAASCQGSAVPATRRPVARLAKGAGHSRPGRRNAAAPASGRERPRASVAVAGPALGHDPPLWRRPNRVAADRGVRAPNKRWRSGGCPGHVARERRPYRSRACVAAGRGDAVSLAESPWRLWAATRARSLRRDRHAQATLGATAVQHGATILGGHAGAKAVGAETGDSAGIAKTFLHGSFLGAMSTLLSSNCVRRLSICSRQFPSACQRNSLPDRGLSPNRRQRWPWLQRQRARKCTPTAGKCESLVHHRADCADRLGAAPIRPMVDSAIARGQAGDRCVTTL